MVFGILRDMVNERRMICHYVKMFEDLSSEAREIILRGVEGTLYRSGKPACSKDTYQLVKALETKRYLTVHPIDRFIASELEF